MDEITRLSIEELIQLYYCVKICHNLNIYELDSLPSHSLDRNDIVDQNKTYNNLLRKLKDLLASRGIDILSLEKRYG